MINRSGEGEKWRLLGFMAFAHKHSAVKKICFFIYKMAPVFYQCFYAVIAAYLLYYRSNKVGLYLFVPLVCMLTSYGLRHIVKKQRPYARYGYILDYDIKRKKSYSFPSNHSTASMIIAYAIGFVNIYAGGVLFIFAILTGISRVCLGIHYFSDVLAGWVLSTFFAVIGFYILAF